MDKGRDGTHPDAGSPILLVEDDRQAREMISSVLAEAGYTVKTASRGCAATALLRSETFPAIVLDVGLPDTNGFVLCREWRSAGVPSAVLFLTARSEVGSRVMGLDAGGDDYLCKPFAVAELKARLRALLRRANVGARERVFRRGDLLVDFGRRIVFRGSTEIPVTRRELEVLERLARSKGHAVSRDDILDPIWGKATPEAGASLEIIIGRLRRKLSPAAGEDLIRTLRGFGYALAFPEAAEN